MSDETADGENERDTLRPVAGGDAYSAETVMRDVPPDVLKKARSELLAHLAAEPDSVPPDAKEPKEGAKSSSSKKTSAKAKHGEVDEEQEQDETSGQVTKPDKPASEASGAPPPEPETKVVTSPRDRPLSAPPALPMSKLPAGQLVLLVVAIAAVVAVLVYMAK